MSINSRNTTKKSKYKTSFSCLDLQEHLSPRPDLIARIQTAAGEVEAAWSCSFTPEQEAAHAQLARLVVSDNSTGLEPGLKTLRKAQRSGYGVAQLEPLCRELRCAYATLTTEAGEVRASARRFGWGVEISGEHIEFTFKRAGRVMERVSL
jgi:hypothetical protein